MSRHVLNMLLLAGLVVFMGINWATGRDMSEPNYDFIPEMLHSIPYDTFAANPNFADGKTLQTPISGTIAQGQLPLYFDATPEDALRAGEELSNPVDPGEQNAVLRGARVYGIFCLPCHGPTGKGDGTVSLRGFPPPPTFHAENSLKMKDGQMFHVITYGQANMPPYAGQVSREDRWKAILHIRALQAKEATAVAQAALATEQAALAAEQSDAVAEESQL